MDEEERHFLCSCCAGSPSDGVRVDRNGATFGSAEETIRVWQAHRDDVIKQQEGFKHLLVLLTEHEVAGQLMPELLALVGSIDIATFAVALRALPGQTQRVASKRLSDLAIQLMQAHEAGSDIIPQGVAILFKVVTAGEFEANEFGKLMEPKGVMLIRAALEAFPRELSVHAHGSVALMCHLTAPMCYLTRPLQEGKWISWYAPISCQDHESAHPYQPNMDLAFEFDFPGADFIIIVFDEQTETCEQGGSGSLWRPRGGLGDGATITFKVPGATITNWHFSGTRFPGKNGCAPLHVPGSKVCMKFKSTERYTEFEYWGWSLKATGARRVCIAPPSWPPWTFRIPDSLDSESEATKAATILSAQWSLSMLPFTCPCCGPISTKAEMLDFQPVPQQELTELAMTCPWEARMMDALRNATTRASFASLVACLHFASESEQDGMEEARQACVGIIRDALSRLDVEGPWLAHEQFCCCC